MDTLILDLLSATLRMFVIMILQPLPVCVVHSWCIFLCYENHKHAIQNFRTELWDKYKYQIHCIHSSSSNNSSYIYVLSNNLLFYLRHGNSAYLKIVLHELIVEKPLSLLPLLIWKLLQDCTWWCFLIHL